MPTRLSGGPLQLTSLDITSVNYMLQQVRRELDEIKGLRGATQFLGDVHVVGSLTLDAPLPWLTSGITGTATTIAGFDATGTAVCLPRTGGVAVPVVVMQNAPTIYSPVLDVPTIASFFLAGHSHQNTVGGGTLDHGLALTGLADDDHSAYLLASSATSRAFFAASWIDLTDGGASTLHSHAAGAGSVTGSGTAGRVAFWDGASSLSSDADFIFSGDNVLLGGAGAPTGTIGLVFADGTALSSMASNTAGLYANDVGGTVQMFAIHEDGLVCNLALVHNFGDSNTFVGKQAGNVTLSGARNVGIGPGNLGALTSGNDNVTIGEDAGTGITTGVSNMLLGRRAGRLLVDGNSNVAIGVQALDAAVSLNDSVAIGTNALGAVTTGIHNIGIGFGVLASVVSGLANVAIGVEALGLTTGSRNTAIGRYAGYTNTTGADNIYLGQEADAGSSGLSFSVAIGKASIVSQSDYIMLGQATRECVGIAGAARPSGTGGLIFPDGTALSSMASNTAGLYADDVGGTVNMFAINEAGTVTQLTGGFNGTVTPVTSITVVNGFVTAVA